MTSFQGRFENHLKASGLISPGETVWIACSGGPDSVALFHLMVPLRKSWKVKIGLLHFNHQLRGKAAEGDARFVRNLAKRFHVPFVLGNPKQSLKAKSKKSLEESAREARFDFFITASAKRKICKIALAHHQNDQAETVLMRVLQGTGTRGLLGIRPKMKMGAANFIRPLLPFTRREIETFLKESRISFRTDNTNASSRFLRSRIRQKLMPWLEKEFNPGVVQAIARIPAIISDEQDWMLELEEKLWASIFRKKKAGILELRRQRFAKSPKPVQYRILDRALKTLDKDAGMNFEAWERLQGHLNRPKTRVSLPRELEMELTPAGIKLYKRPPRRSLHS